MIVFPIPLLFATFIVLSLTAWLGVTRCQKLRVGAAALQRAELLPPADTTPATANRHP